MVVLLAGCLDESGYARKVSEGGRTVPLERTREGTAGEAAPERRGGSPTCAEVAEHLAARTDLDRDSRVIVGQGSVPMSGEQLHKAVQQAFEVICSDRAWSVQARECAMKWEGNAVTERDKLAAACPEIGR